MEATSIYMTSEEKKAYLLLKSVIFHYHGLDDNERADLQATADELDGHKELEWANAFIAEDFFNSFERAREYLNTIIGDRKSTRLNSSHPSRSRMPSSA